MGLFFYVAFSLLWAEHMEAAVTQSPRMKVTETGKKVILECHQTYNHDNMYWYRQDQGQGLRLIYYSYGTESKEKGDITDGYDVSRSKKEDFLLMLERAGSSHTAVYFCASSDGTVLRSCLLSAHKVDLGSLKLGVGSTL